jgi:hypothetical protein
MSRRPRRRSIASMIGASRPKNMPASSLQRLQTSIGRSKGVVVRRPVEIARMQTGALEACLKPSQSFAGKGNMQVFACDRERHAELLVVSTRGEVHDLPVARDIGGRSPTDRCSSIKTPNMRLLRRRARVSSLMHQRDAIHALLMRNSTASQRRAASLRARSHRSPAAIPRSGSRSRKRSFQPSTTSQSRSAIAWALSMLEWLMKMRAKTRPP